MTLSAMWRMDLKMTDGKQGDKLEGRDYKHGDSKVNHKKGKNWERFYQVEGQDPKVEKMSERSLCG